MMAQEDHIKEIIGRFLDGKATPEEVEILDQFYDEHRDSVHREEINHKEYLLLEQRLRRNIEKKIEPSTSWKPLILKVAACVAIVVFVTFLYTSQHYDVKENTPHIASTITRSTDRGQKITLKLPDGTVVKLNSGSKIEFPDKFHSDSREVVLEGEAYFDVVHDPANPFIVRTALANTKVLGTSFNVNSKTNGRTEVTLVTGKVDVASKAFQNNIQLKPHQRAVINVNQSVIDTASVDVSKYIEWKDNVLRFENVPLSEAIATLENWYGVDIKIEGKQLANCKVTGLYKSESLDNVLKSFSFMLRGSFVIDGNKVTLRGKGCNAS